MYIYQQKDWPDFYWNQEQFIALLNTLHHKQGRLLGRMESLGFPLQSEAMLNTLTLDVLKSNEIEGEFLNQDQVRSSLARKLGIDIAGLVSSDRHIEGIVEMILDATQNFNAPLNKERLFYWHASLFPLDKGNMLKMTVADWRKNEGDPMQVVSGPIGRERVHFQAPDSSVLDTEMNYFFDWFNSESNINPIIKAAIAHLWFVTIHPFDDGNGRIARTIADMQLSRADGSVQRFYSMSAQIRKERKQYYDILEKTQKGDLNITNWLEWFLSCLERALTATEEVLGSVLKKAQYWEVLNTKDISERQKLLLNKLLDGFDGKLTSSKWAKIAKCSQDTAQRDIQNLIDQGVLIKEEPGGRSTSYKLFEI